MTEVPGAVATAATEGAVAAVAVAGEASSEGLTVAKADLVADTAVQAENAATAAVPAAEGGPGGAARAEAAAAIRAAAPMVKRFSCRSRCSQSPNRTTRPVQNPGHRRRIHHRQPICTYHRRHTLGMWAAKAKAATTTSSAAAAQ